MRRPKVRRLCEEGADNENKILFAMFAEPKTKDVFYWPSGRLRGVVAFYELSLASMTADHANAGPRAALAVFLHGRESSPASPFPPHHTALLRHAPAG